MKVGNIEYKKACDLPDALPVLIDRSILVLPGTYVPIIIYHDVNIALIEDAIKHNKLIGVLQIKPKTQYKELYKMGCIARITGFNEIGNGKINIALEGICRFHCLKELKTKKIYKTFMIEPILEDFIANDATQEDINIFYPNLYELFSSHLLNGETNIAKLLQEELHNFNNLPLDILLNSLCINAGFTPKEQQLLLEAKNLTERAHLFLNLSQNAALRKYSTKYDNKMKKLQ